MRSAAALLLLLIAACSPSGGAQSGAATSSPHEATPSPSATAIATTAGPYAVIVKDFLQGGLTYTVSLVATDGHVVASASPRKRTEAVQMSNLSTSSTTLYYLDGDSDIRSLRPDGTTALATHVAPWPEPGGRFRSQLGQPPDRSGGAGLHQVPGRHATLRRGSDLEAGTTLSFSHQRTSSSGRPDANGRNWSRRLALMLNPKTGTRDSCVDTATTLPTPRLATGFSHSVTRSTHLSPSRPPARYASTGRMRQR